MDCNCSNKVNDVNPVPERGASRIIGAGTKTSPAKPMGAIPAALADLTDEQDKLTQVLNELAGLISPTLHKREIDDFDHDDARTTNDIELRKEVPRSEGGSDMVEALYMRREHTREQVKKVLGLIKRCQM